MSWTQVYISGLPKSITPSDTEIEEFLSQRYCIENDEDNNIMWAGPGSTLIKRDEGACCRGFAFLTFYSLDGAMTVIARINNDTDEYEDGTSISCNRLKAELSNPKGSAKKGKNKSKDNGQDLHDLRLRRQRKKPVGKHPVITSSDGKKTNLGNKTK